MSVSQRWTAATGGHTSGSPGTASSTPGGECAATRREASPAPAAQDSGSPLSHAASVNTL